VAGWPENTKKRWQQLEGKSHEVRERKERDVV